MSHTKPLDALDMEFQYYSCLIKDLYMLLPNRCQQFLAGAWFRKLSEPIYNVDALRIKRNHYLLMLTICITTNTLKHPFDKYPPDDALLEVSCIQNPNIGGSCATERCKAASDVPEEETTCDLHPEGCPKDTEKISKVLDDQFKFLIDLAEPYVTKLSDPSDRRRARMWITYLNSLTSKCFHMKGIRNDYAMLLAGYLSNDELPGPFVQSPIDKLVPLEDFVKIFDMGNNMVIDPSHPKTLKFFRDLPQPEDGAFAFIGVSGEICDTFAKKK